MFTCKMDRILRLGSGGILGVGQVSKFNGFYSLKYFIPTLVKHDETRFRLGTEAKVASFRSVFSQTNVILKMVHLRLSNL